MSLYGEEAGDIAAVVPIAVAKGADLSTLIDLAYGTVDIDWSEFTNLVGYVYPLDSDTAVATLTVTGPQTGVVKVVLANATTSTLAVATYRYRVWGTHTTNGVTPLLTGPFRVKAVAYL